MLMKMHGRAALPLAIVIALMVGACGPQTVNLTPEGKAIYTAGQVVERLQNLQNAAIQAHDQKQLDTNTTRIIVLFTVDAARVLKETPGGWYPAVSTAWAQVKRDVPQAALPTIQVYWGAIDAVLAAFAPPGP